MARLKGTSGRDRLVGGDRADVILGFGGNDTLVGGGGDDRLFAGEGSDRLSGGTGDDIAILTDLDYTGPDTIDGGGGRDTLDLSEVRLGLFGSLTVEYDSTSGVYSAGLFGDPFDAAPAVTFRSIETLVASRQGDDIFLTGSVLGMTIDAGAGDDWVRPGDGDDIVFGGAGNDLLDSLGFGREEFHGGGGDDTLNVGYWSTGSFDGGSGNDTLGSNGSVDLEAGWAENGGGRRVRIGGIENIDLNGFADGTVARGDDRANVITGNYWPSDGLFYGRGGGDDITGGDGDDQLFGGNGDDAIGGAFGADRLTGGTGADTFRFVDDFFIASRPDPGIDLIADFARAQGDRIDLTGVDADRATTTIDAFRFLGTAAFDGMAGGLRYEIRGDETVVQGDTDGDGAANLEFHLVGAVSLEAGDFVLNATSAPELGRPPLIATELPWS